MEQFVWGNEEKLLAIQRLSDEATEVVPGLYQKIDVKSILSPSKYNWVAELKRKGIG